MANQLKMADVQTILTLHEQGWSARRIARELQMDRATVARHIRLRREAGSKPAIAPTGSAAVGSASPGGPIATGTGAAGDASKPTQASAGSGGMDAGAEGSIPVAELPPVPGHAVSAGPGRPSAAAPWQAVILEKLQAGLEAQRIYQDLTADHDYRGTYYSVRRLVARLGQGTDLPMRRLEYAPGVEAQIDFGRGAWLVDSQGRRRGTWVFRLILSHSRKGYSEAVLRQSTDDFLRCMENAFYAFRGVPQTLVIDNLRAAVSQADWFDPELCPKVRSFAEHYHLAILPTKPYTPRHKGKIENGIKYVKNNALKARTFATLAQQNEHLRQWEQTVADTRIHGTTRRQVAEVFTTVEKPALQPLPESRFDLFQEALRQVHRDGHVQVKEAYYSVGPEFLGQSVWARWDGRMVRIFDIRMKLIAVHAQLPPGKFSTQVGHLALEKISAVERGQEWLLAQTRLIGPQARAWAQQMLRDRGMAGVRVLMGLMSLSHRCALVEVDAACQVALEHGAYRLRNLRRLIALRREGQAIPRQISFEFIQEHPIIRPVKYYQQLLQGKLAQQELQQKPSIEKESL